MIEANLSVGSLAPGGASTKVEAARPLRAELQLADRMYTAVGRSGQLSLGRLERLWKAEGHSEAEIHSVIPDRPSKGVTVRF